MQIPDRKIGRSLFSKLILTVGPVLLVCIAAWSYFHIQYQEGQAMDNLAEESDRLSTTIKLGAHYAMMLNSREDIANIIKNVSRQPEIRNIRIYNKSGEIKYSDNDSEIDQSTNIKDEACYVCHRSDPPISKLDLSERTRIFYSKDGQRLLGILSPIYNEPGCASSDCHVHPKGKKVLGALDLVLSLEQTDHEIASYRQTIVGMTLLVLVLTSTAILVFILKFVRQPVRKLIDGTQAIARGETLHDIGVKQDDEMGRLAAAITEMGREISEKQVELNRQRDEYQNLFERVPCIITVQGRDYKLITYNREFAEKFDPEPGDFCYHAYKGRNSKCIPCPVEKTFEDGRSHFSEETGIDKDGAMQHWMVITSPVKDARGEIVSAMEISLDITERKLLEDELEKSEKKYHAIFNHIPNPVFVLDRDSLDIIDCNNSVAGVYGFSKEEMMNSNFLTLFTARGEADYERIIKTCHVINQVRHNHKDGRIIFVNVRISPTEYHGQRVLLVTSSDITKRLEVEHQLNQAGKLATLGEMATGIAHELNQPLSVIKTVSSFFIKKLSKKEPIEEYTLSTMLTKVDSNVDRATKIITHMRLFARKTEVKLVKVRVNEVLEKAFDIFKQQLKVRGIEVIFEIEPDIPAIMADPDRLEQVFINLLINARDAIEDGREARDAARPEKKIIIKTRSERRKVIVEVRDTGPGIPYDYQDKIFDPFFTTKEVGKGTGLGLSISYGIVKDCGGDIFVSSRENEGACFTLEFPVKDEL